MITAARCGAEDIEDMKEAIATVKTGQVTYAVRDSVFDDIKMHEGDIIGIAEGSIRTKGEDVDEVAFELVSSLTEDGCDIITVFYGEQVTEGQAEGFADRLKEKCGTAK